MTETARTIVYVAVAGVVLGLAWAAGPRPVTLPDDVHTGPFFPDWKDPLAPTSLEVVEYDEETGTVHPFKVMKVDGKWSIPSHFNYPTDAERQLAEAAASVFELQKLSLVSNSKEDHSLYGVIDPDPAQLKGGEKGVGKRILLEDEKGKKLANLIIGKEDKGQAGIRFVRVPGQDAVYRAEIRTDKLSTKFEDWIEKDLLKISSWDIKEVVINDYSFDELNGQILQRDRVFLNYDGNASKWSLKDLADGEELDSDKLNTMKNALDDLKIVDVRRKPDGLSRELRAEEGASLDQAAVRDLASKGFYLTRNGLISNEGEVVVKMSDGVVYVLRFGELALDTGGPSDKKDEAEGDEGEKKDEEESTGANRYIFIMAQLDESLIPKPDLKPVPGAEQPAKPEEEKTSQTAPADETLLAQADDVKLPGEEKDAKEDTAKPEEKPADAKADETKQEAKPEDAKPATEAKDEKADAKSEDKDAKTEEKDAKEEPKSKADVDRERQEIEKENKRKQDEYNDKLKKAKDRVKELNDRFADWYYVISDAEYKKIHLSRTDIIKKKEGGTDEKSEDKTGVEAFQKLKQEGLKE